MTATIGSASARAVVVATTGHTDIDALRAEPLRALVRRALTEVASTAASALRSVARRSATPGRRGPRLVLVSSLAPGADQIVADEALRCGYELHAVVPGTVESYRAQLEGPTRAEFDRLLHASSALVETGSALPTGRDADAGRTRRAAYAEATTHMLRHSDLLVAIADILHRDDLGITGEGIRAALWTGRPVLWIDPSRADRLRWLSHCSETQFAELQRAPAASRFVPDLLAEGEPASSADDIVIETLRAKVTQILADRSAALCYRAEPVPARRSRVLRFAAGLWDAVIGRRLPVRLPASTGVRKPDGEGGGALAHWWTRQRDGYAVAWAMIRSVFTPSRDASASAPSVAASAADGDVETLVSAVERERNRARELASFYAGAHRSSFLAIALLAVGAVALASIPAGDGAHSRLTMMLAFAELVLLVTMLALYYANRTRRWQERSLDYRLLAERFRHATALMLVGTEWTGAAALPVQYSDQRPGKTWIEPYFHRSMVHIVERFERPSNGGAPWLRFDDDPANAAYVDACRRYVLGSWLASQARYHEETATRYQALELLFDAVQFTLLVFTIGLCVAQVFAHRPWLGFFAGVFPALSGSLASIAGQAEIVRLRDRSLSMRRAIGRTLGTLSQSGAVSSSASLRRAVEAAAGDLLEEAIEWRVLFRFRPISSP
jgi:hypothetical protein